MSWRKSNIIKANLDNDALKCPVCNVVPNKKVYQCRYGHIHCQSCVAKSSTCSLCESSDERSDFSRNLFMESLLDRMRFECLFSKRGCKIKSNRMEFYNHIISCDYGFSIGLCKLFGHTNCDFKLQYGNAVEFINHLRTKHRSASVSWPPNACFSADLILKDFFSKGIVKNLKLATWYFLLENWPPAPKTIFIILCKIKKGELSFVCLNLHIDKPSLPQHPSWTFTADWLNMGLTINTNAGVTNIKIQLPLICGCDKDMEKFLEDPPFKISISYLLRQRRLCTIHSDCALSITNDASFGSNPRPQVNYPFFPMEITGNFEHNHNIVVLVETK